MQVFTATKADGAATAAIKCYSALKAQ